MTERGGTEPESGTAAQLRELRLLSSTITLLQARDLSSGLAAFVSELSDELSLDSVTITVISDRDLPGLGVGDAPRPAPLPVHASAPSPLPLAVAPGALFALPLQRGGQAIGELSARAREGLSPSALESLGKVCDMLAVAIDGARLLHDEQETVAGLRELAQLKTTFLGSVSHELRTTVTIIEGFAMLLSRQSAQLDESQRADFVDRIRRSARSLGTLVEDLLDLARLEGSGITVATQAVDLSELVPKIVDQVSSVLDRREVVMRIAPDVIARCDPGAIERILVNLLLNAAKYTPAGTEVAVGLRAEARQAVLTVADRGPGIPVAERSRIFERFHRIGDGGPDLIRGMGIGLALVRYLVDLHGGTISVDETPGGGARFEVALPLGDE